MHKVVHYVLFGFITMMVWGLAPIVSADPINPPVWSTVEKKFLLNSGRQPTYPSEFLPIIETRNQYELGKLAALRFLEWVKNHPRGVVSLTSGSTPEFFIKYLSYYKKNWHKPKIQAELKSFGINSEKFPDTTNLRFVQIEEYFPISSKHYKKVSNYIQRHYCSILGLKKENILLMDVVDRGILAEKGLNVIFMNGKVDLSIMKNKPSSQLEAWQQQAIREVLSFCKEYEKKVRQWGGIDFFVGSISYGGHLGFIAPGTKADSTTHIVKLDYQTAAHAAKDLGGIEHASDKLAITIGLGTITLKPKAIMIVMASGDAKAKVVKDLVENKYDIKYPTTILQKFPNTRLYATTSALQQLTDRRTEDIKIASKSGWSQDLIEAVIIEIAQAEHKEITALTREIVESYPRGELLMENPPKQLEAMLQDVRYSIIHKIEAGVELSNNKGNRILHTGPHHNDIMLAYFPIIDSLIHKGKNHFAYLTSGFNSVADSHVLNALNRVSDAWINQEQDTIFKKSYTNVISRFRNAFIKNDMEQMNLLETTIVLKHLVYIYDIKSSAQLKHTIRWLKDEYFPNKNPGDLDIPSIKLLKGMMRESEADRLWALKNVPLHNITHFRSGFYSGREFAKTPRFNVDVLPFINMYNDFRPDILTVADDPQSAPPKTHYYVLQIIADALRSKEAIVNNKLEIWGYRNIWFRYAIHEANVFIPVSEHMQHAQRKSFSSCFKTQIEASFPSPLYEGTFPEIAINTQIEQLAALKELLGADYFNKNPRAEIRTANGIIFLNKMTINDFFKRAADLQLALELEDSFYS